MPLSFTEVFRRGLVLPLSKEALDEMHAGSLSDVNAFRAVMFLDDPQFYRVWETGVFSDINQECSLLIDDYETTEIKDGFAWIAGQLKAAASRQTVEAQDQALLHRMAHLMLEAEALKASVFCVF